MIERLQRMPVPVLPTFVGTLTLSNVYNTMGYPWVRHLTMWAATIILLLYIVKEGLIKSTCADWRANFHVPRGKKSQEYFVYFKIF